MEGDKGATKRKNHQDNIVSERHRRRKRMQSWRLGINALLILKKVRSFDWR